MVPRMPIVATGVRTVAGPDGLPKRAAGHEAERAARHADSGRAAVGGGIVDEAIDGHPRIGADGEGGPVEQQDLQLARRAGAHLVVEDHLLPQHGRARPCSSPALRISTLLRIAALMPTAFAWASDRRGGQRRGRRGGEASPEAHCAHRFYLLPWRAGRGIAPQAAVTSAQSGVGRSACRQQVELDSRALAIVEPAQQRHVEQARRDRIGLAISTRSSVAERRPAGRLRRSAGGPAPCRCRP